MLFRFLLIVILLLASVEGAPINICRHDLWTNIPAGTRVVSRTRVCIIGQDNCFLHKQCKGPKDYGLDGILPPMIPWNKVNIYYVVFNIIIFLLGTFIGVIYNTIRRHLKKDKSRRNDEDKETSDKPIGKHENKLIIGNGEAARRPMAEKSDSLKNTKINNQQFGDKIPKFEARQKVIINSDKQQEDEEHIPPPQHVSGIPSQVYVFLPELKIRLSQIRQLGSVRSRCEPTMNMGSSQRRLYISKNRQIPGSVSVLPH